MKAVILAAGMGTRLKAITYKKPKALIEVVGKPIINYQIDNLLNNGIEDIIICVGYRSIDLIEHCKINYPKVNFEFIENKNYSETNNMYSLYLAAKHLNNDVFVMNADVVFDGNIIKGMINSPNSVIATDVGRYIEESMKISLNQDGYITDISKNLLPGDTFGCSIDVYKFIKNDIEILRTQLINIIEEDGNLNQWTESLFQKSIKSNHIKVKPYNIRNDRWFEIDNNEDLYQAELLFNSHVKKIKNKTVFFLDRDGTLTLENNLLGMVDELFIKLKEKNVHFYCLTNNSSKTKKEHLNIFTDLGVDIEENQLIVSTDSLIHHLKNNGLLKIYLIANANVTEHFKNEGFLITDKNPDALVLTYDTEINYDKFKKATYLINADIPYFATHLDIVCPTPKGSIPDIGTFIKVLEMTTGKTPSEIFGKPSKNLINAILKEEGFEYKDCVIVGDRLYTDIALATGSEMTSILVLSGETQREDVEFSKIKPDIIVKDINELINLL